MVFAATTIPRIANSGAEDTLQSSREGVAGGLPFSRGQPGLIPVAFGEAIGKKFFHQFRGICGGRFFQGAGGGLNHIGEREEGGFGGLGNGSGVAERRWVDGGNVFIPESKDLSSRACIFFMLKGALIKVPNEGGSVVFSNCFPNSSGETMEARHGEPVFDVG